MAKTVGDLMTRGPVMVGPAATSRCAESPAIELDPKSAPADIIAADPNR